MTAKELKDLISSNWRDDEDVTFLVHDDQGDWRETLVEVIDHTQKILTGHWEIAWIPPRGDMSFDWKPATAEECEKMDIVRQRKRFVHNGGSTADTCKVIKIGCF